MKNLSVIKKIISQFSERRIAVIGDMMLDHYLWGTVDRISAEAPVPVVDIKKEEYRLGGAANVVHNLTSLNSKADVYGVCGNDKYSEQLNLLFKEIEVNSAFIINDETRPTTLKTRVIASQQQIVRCDFEKREDIGKVIEDELIALLTANIKSYDAIILEDYNKGLLSKELIKKTIELAVQNNIPITVDPKFKNFFEYKNCTVFKPNLLELQKNLGLEITNHQELINAAKALFDRVTPEYLIITRGEKGLIIFDKELNQFEIPTFAREVFDVSGAGDTVISVLTLCLACGCHIQDAAIIANHAAGAVCGKIGIAPASIKDIIHSVEYFELLKEES